MRTPELKKEGKYEKNCGSMLQTQDHILARMKEKEKGAVV